MFDSLFGPARLGGDGVNTTQDGRTVRLVLYKYDSCPFCLRVFAAIDRLGLNIEYRDVRKDPAWREDLRKRTGRTTVPCLLIDDVPMFESADIVRWMVGNFARKTA